MQKHRLSENIRQLADSIGIDALGFANAHLNTDVPYHLFKRNVSITLARAEKLAVDKRSNQL